MKTIKGYKFIQSDMTSKNGDSVIWKVGEWKKHEGKIELCQSGFHACLTPQQSLDYIYGEKWFIVEARGEILHQENDKFVASEMRLIKEIQKGEEHKILKKFKKPLDFTELKTKLEGIPTKDDVVNLVKEIDKIKWFKPQQPNKFKLKLKVDSILKAFKIDFGCELVLNPLRSTADWFSAWDSARASAWDSAMTSAMASARDSARASAMTSARDSARASAWDSAWDSAWASAWDSAMASAWASAWDSARASAWDSARASAWDSAWASAWASEFELVKDLMKAKGYDKNPFKELLELWKMGLYPVGVLKDKKFHVYYVPKQKVKSK